MWPVYVLVFNLFGLWLVARIVFGGGGNIAYQSVQPVVSVGQWVQQLLMVQMWNNQYLDGASWVGPTWSLSAEWLAYMLFPVAALVFRADTTYCRKQVRPRRATARCAATSRCRAKADISRCGLFAPTCLFGDVG